MRIVFMGTPHFAAAHLRALAAAGHQVVGVFCQPDKPQGRSMHWLAPPTKSCACDLSIPVFQPKKLAQKSLAVLQELQPDLIVVAAYGRLLPKAILELPRFGCVNVHASILPKYRGAAPIQWAVANGDIETGVALMFMDVGLDTGDVLACHKVPIEPTDTSETLFEKLSVVGCELLVNSLPALEAGQLVRVPQDHEAATLAPPLSRQDGVLDWNMPARLLECRIRGFHPWPGTSTQFRGASLKIFPGAQVVNWPSQEVPGTVLALDRNGLTVCCGQSALLLTDVQAEGRKRMSARDFAQGARVQIGEFLG